MHTERLRWGRGIFPTESETPQRPPSRRGPSVSVGRPGPARRPPTPLGRSRSGTVIPFKSESASTTVSDLDESSFFMRHESSSHTSVSRGNDTWVVNLRVCETVPVVLPPTVPGNAPPPSAVQRIRPHAGSDIEYIHRKTQKVMHRTDLQGRDRHRTARVPRRRSDGNGTSRTFPDPQGSAGRPRPPDAAGQRTCCSFRSGPPETTRLSPTCGPRRGRTQGSTTPSHPRRATNSKGISTPGTTRVFHPLRGHRGSRPVPHPSYDDEKNPLGSSVSQTLPPSPILS